MALVTKHLCLLRSIGQMLGFLVFTPLFGKNYNSLQIVIVPIIVVEM